MSISILGRVGWGLLGSTALAGTIFGLIGCRKKEAETRLNLDSTDQHQSTYELISGRDAMPSGLSLRCKKITPFDVRELPTKPKEQLAILTRYRDAKASYDAISTALSRTPNEEEGKSLVAAVAAINALGAEKVFLPNKSLDSNKDNIYEALKFLEFLRDLKPDGECTLIDEKNRANPSPHQIQCQTAKDWQTDNLRVKWRSYECEREDGTKDIRLITQLNQNVLPSVEASVTTYIND